MMKRRQFLKALTITTASIPLINLTEPKIIAWTAREGGVWIEGPLPTAFRPAAIKYDNGKIYDFILLELGFDPWR